MLDREFHDSVRPGLIAMLPRLMRFADLAAGSRSEGLPLLRRALRRMLAEEHRYQRGTALDCWAFGEIYREWLADLREHPHPIAIEPYDEEFAYLFGGADAPSDPLTIDFVRALPPPQRLTLLLVYGERFDHIDAGRVLDAAPDTVAARLVRITAALADRLRGVTTASNLGEMELAS